jgi:hypothetical protein
MRAHPITPPLINHIRIIAIRRDKETLIEFILRYNFVARPPIITSHQADRHGLSTITSPTLFAQTNDGGATVRGRVTDATGAALTGASITLGNLATGLERVVVTDANGNFAFEAKHAQQQLTHNQDMLRHPAVNDLERRHFGPRQDFRYRAHNRSDRRCGRRRDRYGAAVRLEL